MVGHGELPNKIAEEIAREAKAEVARAAQLAWETDKVVEKRHQGQQYDSGASEDGAEDGVVTPCFS
jgi:hypothetical protein